MPITDYTDVIPMKNALITLAIFGYTSIASAEEKTALAEAAETMKPIIEVPA